MMIQNASSGYIGSVSPSSTSTQGTSVPESKIESLKEVTSESQGKTAQMDRIESEIRETERAIKNFNKQASNPKYSPEQQDKFASSRDSLVSRLQDLQTARSDLIKTGNAYTTQLIKIQEARAKEAEVNVPSQVPKKDTFAQDFVHTQFPSLDVNALVVEGKRKLELSYQPTLQTMPRTVSPQETLNISQPVKVNLPESKTFSTVKRSEEVFGKGIKFEDTISRLQEKTGDNPLLLAPIGFGVGVGKLAYGLTIGLPQTIKGTVEMAKNPREGGYQFGQQLKTNPSYTIGEFAGQAYGGRVISEIPIPKIVTKKFTVPSTEVKTYTPYEYVNVLKKKYPNRLDVEFNALNLKGGSLGRAKLENGKVNVELFGYDIAKAKGEVGKVSDSTVEFYKKYQGEDISNLQGLKTKITESKVLQHELQHAEDFLSKGRAREQEAFLNSALTNKFSVPQVGTKVVTKRSVTFQPLREFITEKYSNVLKKFEPRLVEARTSDTTSMQFQQNILLNKDVLSGVSKSESGGMYKIGSRYFDVKAVEQGKLLDLSESQKGYTGVGTIKVREVGYTLGGEKLPLGFTKEVPVSTKAITYLKDEGVSKTFASSKIGDVSRQVGIKSIQKTTPEGLSITDDIGASVDIVKRKFVNSQIIKGRSAELLKTSESAVTGEPFERTLTRSDVLSLERRPFENLKKDLFPSRIQKKALKNFESTSSSGEVLVLESKQTSVPVSTIAQSNMASTVKNIFVESELLRAKSLGKTMSKSLGVTSAVTSESESTLQSVKVESLPMSMSISSNAISSSTSIINEPILTQTPKSELSRSFDLVTLPKSLTDLNVGVKNVVEQLPKQDIKLSQENKLSQEQQQIPKQLLDQSAVPKQVEIIKPLITNVYGLPKVITKKSSSKKKSKFITEVKKKGKFIPVAISENVSIAFEKGIQNVRNTASASARVIEEGKGIVKPFIVPSDFGLSKKNKFTLVQKREKRISTLGEKIEIPYASKRRRLI